MEFLQLTYFCSAAETENFAKTARKYGVPATGVSQSIRRLEKELGVTLFDRSANEVKLNARGRLFYQDARSTLEILEEARKKVREEEMEGTVRLLVKTNRQLVTKTIFAFHEKYKNVAFDVDLEPDPDIGKYDLIITDNFTHRAPYKRNRLLIDNIVLILAPEHPLAQKEALALEDLQDAYFICCHEGNGMHRLTQHICSLANFTPKIIAWCDDAATQIRWVEAGLGVALVPEWACRSYFSEKLLVRRVTDVKRQTVVCYNKRKLMPKATRLFLDMLYTAAQTLTLG